MAEDTHTTERDTRDARYDGMFLGEVVQIGPEVDPNKVGQILVKVPGLLEPSSLPAFPIGRAFGVNNGSWWIPEVGTNVIVFLNQGDVDHPYYLPGPWGAPDGVSDVPDQAPNGSVDHRVERWRDFHVTFNGEDGSETFTIEDLGSGTKIVIDRPSGGDFLRDVEGAEVINVAGDRDVPVETGDETHTVAVGKRTTSIQGDETKTVIAGNDLKTITAGNETTNVLVGNSTETVALGSKIMTTGAAILQTAGTLFTLLAGGAVSITGASVVVNSGAGPSTMLSGGLMTRTFLGGILESVTGAVARTINGALTETLIGAVFHGVTGTFGRTVSGLATYTFNGGLAIIGTGLALGTGPGHKVLVNLDVIAAINVMITAHNTHVHGGIMAGAASTALPSVLVPSIIAPGNPVPFNETDMLTVNVSAT